MLSPKPAIICSNTALTSFSIIFILLFYSVSHYKVFIKLQNLYVNNTSSQSASIVEQKFWDDIKISNIRSSLLNMNLGDVTVKKFGKENDFLVKIETVDSQNANSIKSINSKLSKDLGKSEIKLSFRLIPK